MCEESRAAGGEPSAEGLRAPPDQVRGEGRGPGAPGTALVDCPACGAPALGPRSEGLPTGAVLMPTVDAGDDRAFGGGEDAGARGFRFVAEGERITLGAGRTCAPPSGEPPASVCTCTVTLD